MLLTSLRRLPHAALLLALGCAFPIRSTALTPISDATASSTTPPDLYSLLVVEAHVPPMDRGGHEWDDGDGPDPFVRIYRDDVLVWQSETIENTLTPRFAAALPKNLRAPSNAHLRFELWDEDLTPHVIGVWDGHGLPPSALPDVDARIRLDGGAELTIRANQARPHRGVGITSYEARSDRFRLVEVEAFSPAARAGLEPGDDIVGIGDKTVKQLGEASAASALSMAAERESTLRVERDGQSREVSLDRDYCWLSM